MVLGGTNARACENVRRSETKAKTETGSVRDRIMGAGFGAFLEHGYTKASTLDIATRARVSKRELYAQFKSKEALFRAGIAQRSATMSIALDVPNVVNREDMVETLVAVGQSMLSELTQNDVLAVYRLAIAESARSPQIARTLDRAGRGATRKALIEFFESCIERGLIEPGDPDVMTGEFCSLLLSDTMLRLLLGVAKKPNPHEAAARAHAAAKAFLALHPLPSS